MPKTGRKSRISGITLVELFAALGLLAVVMTFAAAPLERMSARVDVDIARDEISRMITVARRAAANHGIPVIISVSNRLGRTHLEARYSYRWRNLRLDPIPSFSLPPGVNMVLSRGSSRIELDREGVATQGENIRLFSSVNPDYAVGISLDNPVAGVTPAAQ